MVRNLILDSNKMQVNHISDFENKLSKIALLFSDTYHIIDTIDGSIDYLDVSYEFIEHDNNKIEIIAKDQFDNTVTEEIDMKILIEAFKNSYLSGKFIKNGIYSLLKRIGYKICDQKDSHKAILKNFLAKSNSIVYKNNLPIVVVSESENDEYFYELSKQKTDSNNNVLIVMNFFNENMINSIYQNPINELFNINEENNTVELISKKSEQCDYKIVAYNKNIDKIFIINLDLENGQLFRIKKVEIVSDFKNTKNMFKENYNDKSRILDKLLSYNISSHTEDLFDLID